MKTQLHTLGEPIRLSESHTNITPMHLNKGAYPIEAYAHFYDETRTLVLEDAYFKPTRFLKKDATTRLTALLKSLDLGTTGRAIASITFKRVLPAVGVIASVANVARAEDKPKAVVTEGVITAASVGSSLATAGLAIGLGATPIGWPVLGAALVGGVGGSVAASQGLELARRRTTKSQPKTTRRKSDAIDEYEALLGEAIQGTKRFYDPTATVDRLAEELAQKRTVTKNPGLEVNADKIKLQKLTPEQEATIIEAAKTKAAYEEAVRLKKHEQEINEAARNFVASVGTCADAIGKNLSQGGYRIAGKVFSTISNTISGVMAAQSAGAFAAKLFGSAATGNFVAAALTIGTIFTSILGLIGDDESNSQAILDAIQAVHSEVREARKEIREVREDIRNLAAMTMKGFEQVIANQKIIFESIERTQRFLTQFYDEFVRFHSEFKQHASIAEARLEAIDFRPLKEANLIVDRFLGDRGTPVTVEELRNRLSVQENWLLSDAKG